MIRVGQMVLLLWRMMCRTAFVGWVDVMMALMALLAGELGGRATRHDEEYEVVQPMRRQSIAVALHSPPRQGRGERLNRALGGYSPFWGCMDGGQGARTHWLWRIF